MEVGFGQVDGAPADKMRFRCLVATLVKVSPYFLSGKRFMHSKSHNLFRNLEIHSPVAYLTPVFITVRDAALSDDRLYLVGELRAFFSCFMIRCQQGAKEIGRVSAGLSGTRKRCNSIQRQQRGQIGSGEVKRLLLMEYREYSIFPRSIRHPSSRP